MDKGIILQGIDVLDILSLASRRNKKFQAIMLNQIEEVLDKNSEEFPLVRKIILDGMNNYTRTILRSFFGGVEDLIK
jgi:hypothetical protein